MSGELSESQKIEREELKAKVQQQMRQIEIQRDSIEVLTLELEKVNTKLANVPDKLPKVSFVDLVGSICFLYSSSSDVCIILYPPSGWAALDFPMYGYRYVNRGVFSYRSVQDSLQWPEALLEMHSRVINILNMFLKVTQYWKMEIGKLKFHWHLLYIIHNNDNEYCNWD